MIKNHTLELLDWNNADTIERLASSLKSYNLSITTTDTVFGLLALLDEQGFIKLNQAKGSRSDKPYLILIKSAKKIIHFSDQKISDCIMKQIDTCWPGPVTLIFKARKELPSCMVSQEGTVALRSPNHIGLQKVLDHFDGLFSTSANRSGQPIPYTIDQIDEKLCHEIKYLIIDKEEQQTEQLPSTILDLTQIEDGKIKVVREGAFPIKTLENIYGKKFDQ